MNVKAVLPRAPVVRAKLKTVQVQAAIEATIIPATGEIVIVENGEYNVSPYETAVVNVPIPPNYGEIIWNGYTLEVR